MHASWASVASSAKWSVVEYGGLALISFFSLVVYARFLPPADFGLFSIAVSIIELMTALVGMLFHDALVQRSNVRELHYDTALTATLGLSAVLVALCWGIAPLVARKVATPEAEPVLLWLSLSLPLTAASAPVIARRRRELDFRALAVSSLTGRAGGAAVGIPLVLLGFGVWGLVAQQVLFVLLSSLVLWVRCANRPRLRFRMSEFRDLIGFGLACVSDLMLIFSVKRIFIVASGVMLGTYGAGLLNLAFRAVDTLSSIALTSVSQIAFPVLSALRFDERRFRWVFPRALALVSLVLYFGFVLLGATAPEVVALLFGPQWVRISPYVTLLSLLLLSGSARTPMCAALKAMGRPRDLVLSQVAELAFILTAIALFGVPSVPWAIGIWMVREAVGSAVLVWMFCRARQMTLGQLLACIRTPLVAALAMFVAVSGCRDLIAQDLSPLGSLLVLGTIGATVYFTCVALLDRSLITELIRFVRSAFRRVQPAAA